MAAAATLAYTFWPDPDTGMDDRKNQAPSGTGKVAARPAGIVPAAFLGAWEGVVQGSPTHPRETGRFEITQGAAGSKSAVYVQVAENRLCMGRSRLVSADEDKVVLGESDVTTSVPAQRCVPAAHQTLTLRSPTSWSGPRAPRRPPSARPPPAPRSSPRASSAPGRASPPRRSTARTTTATPRR